MINNELLNYIRQQLSLNIKREEITNNLKSQGWTDADISEAFTNVVPMSTPFVPAPTSLGVAETVVDSFQPVKRRKKIVYIILVLILVGALAGGVYAYYSGMFMSTSRLTSEAIYNARSAKSVNYDITVSADLSEISTAGGISPIFLGGINSKQFNLTSKGSYDNSDLENLKGSSSIFINTGSSSVEVEFRVLSETLYAVLKKAPALAFLPMIADYENKWVSFPFKSSDGQIAVDNPIIAMSPIDPNILNQLTSEQREHIYQMVRDAHFVKVVRKLSPETISGELSYHFIFDLDREGIITYAEELKEYINTFGKNDSVLSSFDPTSFTKELDKLKDFKGEIWIGRNDKLLHKFVLNFGVQPDVTKTEQVKIKVVGIFSGWNQPVSIIAPAESIPFETLISNIMSSFSSAGSATSSTKTNNTIKLQKN